MATPTKKGSKNTKAKPRRAVVKTTLAKPGQTNAELRQQLTESLQRESATAKELQDCRRQLTEAFEQQTATSEILGVIASSPTDIQPVLDTVAENAARLCEAADAQIRLVEGDRTRSVASFGSLPAPEFTPIGPRNPTGRAILTRQTLHIHDLQERKDEFPESQGLRRGLRTFLSEPMLREGTPIGVINIRRMEVRPFSDRHIKLLKTFAAQAVIAIENVRLFKELQERNSELREALEHQTATSEVLGIISRSPTDVQPVLDAIVESAARVCGIDDVVLRLNESDAMVPRAHFGPIPIGHVRSIDEPQHRWIREHGTLHIPDVHAQDDFPTMGSPGGARTFLFVPLRQQGEFIGVLVARRTEVSSFNPAQIKLLETFADQAVIAIENVRLFQELKESLEQQTATSEILGVIASSPTDIQPVLDTVAQNAAKLCDASDALILRRLDDATVQVAAKYGPIGAPPTQPLTRGIPGSRAILDQQTIHVYDMMAEINGEFSEARDFQQFASARTVLATPLLREGVSVGAILIRRQEVRPFSEKQIALLKTFASQAVIAIENVRLFKELQERNAELREALEHQTATSEVLGIISRSPTDVQPVLDAIVESAARVCGVDDVLLRLDEGSVMIPRAHFGPIPIGRVQISIDEPQYRWMREHGTLHVPDVRERQELQLGIGGGWRTLLAVPLRQQGKPIGALAARRIEVRPFTPAQIKLLETFADQAVIAIENVRLFQELKESLEQQTATSEILGVIASSPTDIQPVLDAVAESAARLCNAKDGVIRLVEGKLLRLVAHQGPIPFLGPSEIPINRGSVTGRAVVEGQPVHIEDLLSVAAPEFPEILEPIAEREGDRTQLAVPLMREAVAIGAILIRRRDVDPFTEKQIDLLKTFAAQAVIAIENVRLFQELKESLEQQTATSEILGVIASSPTDIQPVLNVVAENAARLCDAVDGVIGLPEGDQLRIVAKYGDIPSPETVPLTRDFPAGRAVLDNQTIHIHDILAEIEEYPDARVFQQRTGIRSALNTPLLREDVAIGVISVRRTEVRPFTDKQIALLKTFADQAVIAIENVRLFKELQSRNSELREALEHQTATAEVLGIISRSPTDVQPVLDAIVESAARVCGIDDVVLRLHQGNNSVQRAHFGHIPIPIGRVEISIDEPQYLWMREHGTLHVPDIRAQNDFPTVGTAGNFRTWLAAPLRQQGELIGTLNARRTEVRPFTPAQIKLLETFADQAVIAIENVRLFQELKESLEQQTATSEILGVIASSPTDVQPVFDTIAQSAMRLCDGAMSVVSRYDGELIYLAAHSHVTAEGADVMRQMFPMHPARTGIHGRIILERSVVHISDAQADAEYSQSLSQALHLRSVVGVPMVRDDRVIGAVAVGRTEVRPFTEKEIALLQTFAHQAVIAIENVRLFQELKESLEQQTATSEILGVIASSPTNIQPVLDVVAENAARLCDSHDAQIYRLEGEVVRKVAHYGVVPTPLELGETRPVSRGSASGRAILDRQILHIHDMLSERERDYPDVWHAVQRDGIRTVLSVPLLREGVPIGAIGIRRLEVRPFSEKQIKLLETFADQAVIAIENVRLFKELQSRNSELREALEHQTATAEVLGIISRSPTDVQPVLDAIVESAARVCGIDDLILRLHEGNQSVLRAHFGPLPDPRSAGISIDEPRFNWIREHGTLHIPDVRGQTDFSGLGSTSGSRTFLIVPLRQQVDLIGELVARRIEVRPFTSAQIKLLETFADQAVIAIENVRLFNELKESLEQQTATSEILGVIASSPTDLQPVLDAIAATAARLCGASDAVIHRIDGDQLRPVANYGPLPGRGGRESIPIVRDHIPARAIIDRQTLHIDDLAAVPEDDLPAGFARRVGVRTVLATPLLREGIPIGAILIRRLEVRPFSEKQIKLLETFADQAVIAIENVRLFKELQERTRELMESVEEMKALGEVGQAVSSTLDLQTVLSTIVRHAVQLSGTNCGIIYEYDEPTQEFHLRASYQMEQELVNAYQATPLRLGQGATGRAAETRTPTQIADLRQEQEFATRGMRPILARLGYHSLLAVPLLLEQKIMGALTIYRREAGNFSPEIVNLLQTFATQSVLAIQNARLFREIEEKSKQIETANRHKSEFLANMSHELRTPLTAIIGFSEVLSDKLFGELNDKQNEYMGDIVSSGRHLLSLINDILDLSKVEAGRMELDVTSFDLPMAIENALILIRERATRHGISLHHRVDERLGEILGDERKFKQILLNLLSNAVKFTPQGGRIDVDAALTNESVEVSVSDTGVGIARENQETVFEEFRQVGTDNSKKREGTGLGLTLTRKFVELHGGKIWVESEVGKGSTFTFTLALNQEKFDGQRINTDH